MRSARSSTGSSTRAAGRSTERSGERAGRRSTRQAHLPALPPLRQLRQTDVTRPYVEALEARGIPHLLVGGRAFHEREEIEALRAALAAIEWPDDELSVFATLRGPLFAIGDEELLEWATASAARPRSASSGTVASVTAFRQVFARDTPPDWRICGRSPRRLRLLQQLHRGAQLRVPVGRRRAARAARGDAGARRLRAAHRRRAGARQRAARRRAGAAVRGWAAASRSAASSTSCARRPTPRRPPKRRFSRRTATASA